MEVGNLLEKCLKAAEAPLTGQPPEELKRNYCQCKDSLCPELASLLQEAKEMKWPFVPERWQYKQSVSPADKTNLSDLISKHLLKLLDLLKASIEAQDPHSALAVIFLVDRFIYWTDESSRLLKIAKLLHSKQHERTPIAPQLVIRQARVYLNAGKLQKAENILSTLINSSGSTGCWVYHSDSDRVLVQAVSVQVRGMVLQKLGLWLQAAELIWASLIGYYSLPQPDKKGIGTSLGLLANILVSMNDDDFHTFRTNPDIDYPMLLGNTGSHRLLSAAQAAKMAVVYSQYTPLYVLTNATTQGTCLLSYSFSLECPSSQRTFFLQQAQEAFAIGLLTKAEGQPVTSQQELHTFLKAAYSIAITHKWLGGPQKVVESARQACQTALEGFYRYCCSSSPDRDRLCSEIMCAIDQVKRLLSVVPFPNSDKGSFIPDSYRDVKDSSVSFSLEAFAKIMQKFQNYHKSLCETAAEKSSKTKDGSKLCLTTLATTVVKPIMKHKADASEQQKRSLDSFSVLPTMESSDLPGSPWENLSMSGSGPLRPGSSLSGGSRAMERRGHLSDQSSIPTEHDDEGSDGLSLSPDKEWKQKSPGSNAGFGSRLFPTSAISPNSSSKALGQSPQLEVIQAEVETEDYDENLMADVSSLSQLALKSSSSSLSNSFGSRSSWEKVSVGENSPTCVNLQSRNLYKAATRQRSSDSDGSFFIMGHLDSETSNSAPDVRTKNHIQGTPIKLQPQDNQNTASNHVDEHVLNQSADTEASEEDSFVMLGLNQKAKEVPNEGMSTCRASLWTNPNCHSCLNHYSFAAVAPVGQFELSEQDYRTLLAGVCHECLLRRLHSDVAKFKISNKTAHNALNLKFSKATGLWTAKETCVYIGDQMEMEVKGAQRRPMWVQFLHQEERLSSYVGKDYIKQSGIRFHLEDVERQMTAQNYVTEFNKRLYDKEAMAQIFFIPSEALLILNGDKIVGCITVEPYMLGEFCKLTNNTRKKNTQQEATKYGLAFGHFTYLFSGGQEVVVDLQGWVTNNGKGLTYLTDPQIHSTRIRRGPSDFAEKGLSTFLKEQHGPTCNEICTLLELPPLSQRELQ